MDATTDKVEPVSAGDDDADVVKAALRLYDAAYEREEHNILEGYDDLECRAGNQWPSDVEAERVADGRPVETVNQIPQFVRQVTGDMRQMRPAIKVVPTDAAGNDESAEAMGGLIRYIENRSDAPGIYFQAADSQVTCGIGAWRIISEYAGESTFNQELRIAPIEDALAVLWDEDAVLPTREDAMECLIPIDMARSKFKKLYPEATATDFAPRGEEASRAAFDWTSEDKVRVGEYWYKRKFKKLLALMPDGTVEDVTGEPPEMLSYLTQNGARVDKRDACKVFRALVTATEILEGPDEWPGAYIPIVPVIGEEIRIGRRIVRHGVVRFMKPVQRIYNYMISADIEVTALQPKAPFTGTEKNFEKYQDVWETANSKNHAYLPYTPDAANGGAAPQRVQPPVSSQGIATGIERAQRDFQTVTGIYNASLGARSNETSGKAINARDRQGDTGTFVYPDNWARAIGYTGKILVDLAPKFYDTERVLRIVGEDGKVEKIEINKVQGFDEQGNMRLFNDVTSGSYDVAIQMGPSYATKREEAREGMTAFMQGNQNIAPLIGDLYAKAQDWPLADEIGERLEVLLPPEIRAMKAKKEGKQPPPQKPPQPSPQELEMQAKLQLQQQEAQASLQLKQQEAAADIESARIKAQSEMELKRLMAQLDMQLKREQVSHEMQLQRERASADIELKQMVAASQAEISAQQAAAKAAARPDQQGAM